MPPNGLWAIPEDDLRKYGGYDKPHRQKAKQLLSAAGVTTPLDASTTTRTDFQFFSEFVQDQMSKLGINMKITLADTATAQPVMIRGDFDIGTWIVSLNVDDPDATFSEVATSNAARNWSRVYDPEIDALYEKQSVVFDYQERKKLVKDLDASGLDVNLLGLLCRIRMHWPALEPGGVYYVNERFGPHAVKYFLGVPANYDRTRPWPLVIKLPGAHAFATDPPPAGDQAADIYRAWTQEELSRHGDAVVLMPLLDLKELWGPTYSGMNRVIQPMLHAAGNVNVDAARVYLIGHSMSAHAA